MDENFIHFENVRKDYKAGEVTVTALHDVSFSIGRAEICVIVGESGAGKTTLLNILGGMDSLSEGRVTVDGVDISAFDKKQLTAYRRTDVGFVYKFYSAAKISPHSSPAASSSASQSPARWRRTRSCCFATSRPARWITRPARRY